MSNSPASLAFKHGHAPDDTRLFMGRPLTFLALGAQTNGLAVLTAEAHPGEEPQPHVHEHENEFCYMLEGELAFYLPEDLVLTATPGELLCIPQGQPHAMQVRSPQARYLILVQATGGQPTGMDQFFWQLSQPATGSADAPAAPPTPESIARLSQQLGTRLLSDNEIQTLLPHYAHQAAQ